MKMKHGGKKTDKQIFNAFQKSETSDIKYRTVTNSLRGNYKKKLDLEGFYIKY